MATASTGAQPLLPFDITERKHGGNPESKAANLRIEPHKRTLRERVYARLALAGNHGATCKEIAQLEGREMHAISGRITELKKLGSIQETARTRDGGRVLVAAFIVENKQR